MRLTGFQKAHLQSFSNFLGPPMLPFVCAVLFILSFNVLSGYFYVSLGLVTVPVARGVLSYIGSVMLRPIV